MGPVNPYADRARAAAYAELGIVNTYVLAYRDLPELFAKYTISGQALDYGCGTGRSTRFLRDHGFSVVGVDVSESMVAEARHQEPRSDYRLIAPGDLRDFPDQAFDFVLSVMPFDSIATMQAKVDTLGEISRVLKPGGWKILVASSHEIYLRDWVSFTATDFPENRAAQSGDIVRVIINDIGDGQPVEDILWTEDAYLATFRKTPLRLVETRRPIVGPDEEGQCEWRSERAHAPWIVFVLRKPA